MSSPLPASGRKPTGKYHHGDLRRAMVDEAVRTITDEGIESLTLREAGARLGVSRTALYRHFSDKAALLAAVARDGFQKFRAELESAWEQGPATRCGFTRMGEAYIRFAVGHPSHYRVMFGDFRALCAREPELQEDAQAAFMTFINALVAMQRAGLVRASDPRLIAEFIWATTHGTAMLAINGQFGPDPVGSGRLDQVIAFVLERIWNGIDSGLAPEQP
ncbi:MAG: TetR/AcrR family transcriptional regulator [Vicinamibacterales bacterium]